MPENLPDRLRIARTKLGLTVEQAAKAAGVTRKTWERYEKGGNDPQASSLISLIERGVNPQWLMTGRGEMMGPPINDVGPPGPVDLARLALAIETVDEGLSATDRAMAPAKKADLVVAVYDLFLGSKNEVEKGVVLRLIRTAV